MFDVLFATVRFARPSAPCPWICFCPATVADLYLSVSLWRPLSFFPPYFPTSHYRWGSSTQRLANHLVALEQMFRKQSLRMYVRTCVCVFMWNWVGLEKWKQQLTTTEHTGWGDGLLTYAFRRTDEPLTDFPARLEVGFGIEGTAKD